MKSVFKNRKTYIFLAISLFLFFNILTLIPGMAIPMQDEAATFNLDKEDPLKYGVFIPAPNMYATLSFQGSNQGEFGLMWFQGTEYVRNIVDLPGNDISEAYPQYLSGYMDTASNHDIFNPINTFWLNVSAYNAENDTLSPYHINTAYNYYAMTEGSELNIPLNQSIPMQIDIMITSPGPKILKYNWLTDNPWFFSDNKDLVSPSGKLIGFYEKTVHAVSHGVDIFDYITFVAHETGTYRLLVRAVHALDNPAYLNLEFLSSSISSLPLEKLIFGGNGEDILTLEKIEYSTWQSNWYRISGKKGDIFRFDLNKDYATGVEPQIRIWSPCENRYSRSSAIGEGIHDIYFPTTGNAYISFVDADYGDWYRYSLYLSRYEPIDYNIGDNKTSIRISRDQRKVIGFSLEEDSFVRFNFTSTPPGNPYLDALGTTNATILMSSKALDCYQKIYPLETKIVDNEWFHYYFMPAGNYKAMIKNTNETQDGTFEISSKLIGCQNDTIPINYLTYPDISPSEVLTLEFEPDEYYDSLKQGLAFEINITDPGHYILNATIFASDHLDAIPLTADPAAVVVYNGTTLIYQDFTSEALDPTKSFPALEADHQDYLYIAYQSKWHDMEFNFSVYSEGTNDIDAYVWDGEDFNNFIGITDNTVDFTQNGSVIMSLSDPDYENWKRGADFDLPNINENQYYWARITPDHGNFTKIPHIQLIELSNITLQGDLNFALVRDSGYIYGDYWAPTDQPSISGLFVNQGLEYVENTDSTPLIETDQPYIVGFEEGVYKLLIIPENWGYSGPITIQFAIENYWSYKHQETYNISTLSPDPNLHSFQINNYTSYGYANGTGPFYNYGLTTQYNDTEVSVLKFAGKSYFLLECYGKAYQWTQLIVSTNNVSSYNLYLVQDLPWVANSPNLEVFELASASFPFINNTHEFGVHTDHFYLLFEVDDLDETITFRIALSQYDTVELLASPPIASYTPPLDTNLIIILAIVIPAAIGGAIVVVYILKKKRGGKI